MVVFKSGFVRQLLNSQFPDNARTDVKIPRRKTQMRGNKLVLMLLALTVWLLAACGGTGSAPAQPTAAPTSTEQAAPAPTTAPAATAPMMDHAGSGGTVEHGDVPFDAQFIDSMIEHHRGAIEMAEQALKESARDEIKHLSENIIAAQQQEIDQMTAWRKQWYPDLAATPGMGMDMGHMGIRAEASEPFDQRFITAMISHHQGALQMAQEAQAKAEHAEIKELAGAITKAQEAEIAQMEQWQREWFPQ
jgi:uncharacterized protein (DUF305 family)